MAVLVVADQQGVIYISSVLAEDVPKSDGW